MDGTEQEIAQNKEQATDWGRVLLTGGSGFIAGHCIARLLADGWRVRTTVRELARAPQLRAALRSVAPFGDQVEIVAADLEADAGWDAAADEQVPAGIR